MQYTKEQIAEARMGYGCAKKTYKTARQVYHNAISDMLTGKIDQSQVMRLLEAFKIADYVMKDTFKMWMIARGREK